MFRVLKRAWSCTSTAPHVFYVVLLNCTLREFYFYGYLFRVNLCGSIPRPLMCSHLSHPAPGSFVLVLSCYPRPFLSRCLFFLSFSIKVSYSQSSVAFSSGEQRKYCGRFLNCPRLYVLQLQEFVDLKSSPVTYVPLFLTFGYS
jgi:hypothetical protein